MAVESYGLGAALLDQGLTIVDLTRNSSIYHRVLEDNVGPSVRKLNFNPTCTLQHDNDPKRFSKSTKEWLGQKTDSSGMGMSKSGSTDILWGDLKQDVHAKNPANIPQLKEFCIEEQEKNSFLLISKTSRQL